MFIYKTRYGVDFVRDGQWQISDEEGYSLVCVEVWINGRINKVNTIAEVGDNNMNYIRLFHE